MKKKFNNYRFNLNIVLEKDKLPQCENIDNDIVICQDKSFYTLRDIAEYTGLNYPQVNDIYKGRRHGKKWNGNQLCPTININSI